MLLRWRQPPKLLSDSNTPQFASVMSMVVFTLLLFFMTAPTYHHSISYDLAKVKHPLPMRGADREDAIKVFILRDGQVFIWNRPSESCRFVPEDSRSPERPQH